MKHVAIVCLLVLFAMFTAGAYDAKYINNTHTAKQGLGCEGCHNEAPPADKVKSEKCMECHGTFEDIGKNSDMWPNPHINHNDDLRCEDCHHIHRPSDIYCNSCHEHNFDWVVP